MKMEKKLFKCDDGHVKTDKRGCLKPSQKYKIIFLIVLMSSLYFILKINK